MDRRTPVYLRGLSFGLCFDFLGRSRMSGSSFIADHPFESVSVLVGDSFGRGAYQLLVTLSCPHARRWQCVFGWFHDASDDVFQKNIGQGNLRMGERLQTLDLLGEVCQRGGDSRLELLRGFGTRALPDFVFACGNEEGLLRAEATFLHSGAHLFP